MIKGQIFGARERKKRGEIAKDRAPKFSFDEGLQVLPDVLAQNLGLDLRLNAKVTRLAQSAGVEGPGWRVDYTCNGQSSTEEHGAVVYCGTAFQAGAATDRIHAARLVEIAFRNPLSASRKRCAWF